MAAAFVCISCLPGCPYLADDLGKEKPGEHPLQKWPGRNVSVPG